MKVKIISGTYGHKVGKYIEPKDRTSEPFELEETEAKRLVSLGVAEIITEGVATGGNGEETNPPSVNPSNDENGSNGENEGENEIIVFESDGLKGEPVVEFGVKHILG